MKECNNCGSHVSKTWGRVASDNNGEVHFCMDCPDTRKIGSSEYSATGEVEETDRGPDWCNVG